MATGLNLNIESILYNNENEYLILSEKGLKDLGVILFYNQNNLPISYRYISRYKGLDEFYLYSTVKLNNIKYNNVTKTESGEIKLFYGK